MWVVYSELSKCVNISFRQNWSAGARAIYSLEVLRDASVRTEIIPGGLKARSHQERKLYQHPNQRTMLFCLLLQVEVLSTDVLNAQAL